MKFMKACKNHDVDEMWRLEIRKPLMSRNRDHTATMILNDKLTTIITDQENNLFKLNEIDDFD